jgi:hypothetical protein
MAAKRRHSCGQLDAEAHGWLHGELGVPWGLEAKRRRQLGDLSNTATVHSCPSSPIGEALEAVGGKAVARLCWCSSR